jgi:hypothetical protein
MTAEEPAGTHERAWTLPAAAGLAALEVTVTIAVLLYNSHLGRPAFLVVLALKYPVCWMLLRRQAWAFLAPLLFSSAHLFPRAQLPRR